jgi:hypothetical protein
MKHVVKKIQQGIAASQIRSKDLQKKLAALPDDSGPEVRVLYGRQLAKEKKYQEKMTLALTADPPQNKKPSLFRILILTLLLMILVFLLVFR